MVDEIEIVETDVASLRADHREQMLQIFVDAFSGEPMFQYMFPDEAKRPGQVRWGVDRKWALMSSRYTLALALRDDVVKGMIWWYAPGSTITSSIGSQLAAGYAWAPFRFGWSVFRRMYRCGGHEQQLLQRIAGEPSWLLDVIGVDPSAHRLGIGGRLMAPVFARADRDGVASWVITHNQRNVAFYTKYGYEPQFEEEVPGGGPVAYVLRRPPGKG